MKKLFTAIAITAFAFVGTSVNADARPGDGRGYSQPASTIYVSGYRYCRPVYTQKYFIGYDHCGNPRWGYRTVSAPSHQSRGSSCGSNYDNRGYQSRGYDNHRSSGASVQFRFGR
ncbi:MAG: hypothetical protein NWR03_07440 [Akkermansiaceae bacterium]|nr:hypothetical protein [Akkermansiaceae bacterium]MDP4897593.1 hypothetical protein [Akkermansiaceae bacterium]